MASNTLDTSNQARFNAKQALRQALGAYAGDPKHPAVAAAMADLISLKSMMAPVHQTDLLDGDWLLISAPSFPDGELRADGTYAYTLGRLAFNMFQPTGLKVVINRVTQPVFPLDESPRRTHDIVVEFTTLSEAIAPLQGVVRNLGVCQFSSDTTLQVQFTGGVLEPAQTTDLTLWKTVFGNPEKSPSGPKDWFQGMLLKIMFGLVPPKGMDVQSGKIEFCMKRSPRGTLEILYLDEELRITKGEKGTILICERL